MTYAICKNRLEWSDYGDLVPEANTALMALSKAVENSGLEPQLLELVKLRASQINGCAFCVQWHSMALRNMRTADERIYLVAAWRNASIYTDRERAAFAWCDALTHVAENEIDDALYDAVSTQFTVVELAALTSAIIMINAWNRIGKAYRFTPMKSKKSQID